MKKHFLAVVGVLANNRFFAVVGVLANNRFCRLFSLKTAVFALILAFSACFPTKKPTTPTRPNTPPTRPSQPPIADLPYGKMDTIAWKIDDSKPPITSSGGSATPQNPSSPTSPSEPQPPTGRVAEPGRTYRLALVLPFLTDKFSPDSAALPKNSRIGLQFYAGAKLAFEKLSTENGINLEVSVVDSKVSDTDFAQVLKKQELQKADVILGGFRSSHVQGLADFGRLNGKIVLSPDIVSAGLAKQNPKFIQLNPGLESHAQGILRHVLRANRAENVVLVCREKERERLAFFQNAAPSRLTEIVAPDADEIFKSDLRPFFKTGQTTVFVVPSWSSQDFVNSFLQKVKSQRGKNAVEIFGMPQWLAFENIEADLFESLAVHVSAAKWVDLGSPDVQAFREKFYLETGTIPTDDAFAGYDAAIWAARILRERGLDFPKNLASVEARGLATRYIFRPVGPTDDRMQPSEHWENRGVFLLRFEKFRFRPVD